MKKYHYAVIGHPVSHSLSPTIHQLFAKQLNINIQYQAIDIHPSQFSKQLPELFSHTLQGANITTPFKEKCSHLVNEITDRAKTINSINTIWWQDNKLFADSTDGIGFYLDLKRLNINLHHKRILIFGAGGAVRAILPTLFTGNIQYIDIYNRTLDTTKQLINDFQQLGTINMVQSHELSQKEYDIIINSLPIDCYPPQLPTSIHFFHKNTLFYDLCYSLKTTTMQQWAKKIGIEQQFNGLGMLIYQAAESAKIWYRKDVDTSLVFKFFDKQNK